MAFLRRLTTRHRRPVFIEHRSRVSTGLHFELRTVFRGTDALTIIYKSVNDLLAAETMVLSDDCHIKRVWAQYDK